MKIFTLAWEFPPRMSGESIVCLRMLKASKHQYDVCCGGHQEALTVADNIVAYPLKGKYLKWPFAAAMLFIKLNKRHHYDAIYSRVMPPNGHLAGLIIKLIKPKIKWIVYFSDPIWNSPFIRLRSLFVPDHLKGPNYLLMKIFGIPARIAIHTGNMLVFNNERLARFVTGRSYDKLKHKIVIVPYGHEGISETASIKNDKYIIAHVGQIYGSRTFGALIKALVLLKQNHNDLYKRLQINQVGFICKTEIERVLNSEVQDCFQILGEVGYGESISRMQEADSLLVIDPFFQEKKNNIYVPAKVFDYMSTGLPIIAIADADSATADIMLQIKGTRASHDKAEIYKMLLNIFHGKMEDPDPLLYNKFNYNLQVKKLDDAIDLI